MPTVTREQFVHRGRFQGLRTIARFNWPMYVAAAVAFALGGAALLALQLPRWVEIPLWCALGLAGFWTIASLVASHLVYDRSILLKWTWLRERFDRAPVRWANFHAGHDESSAALVRMFGAGGETFDFFDAAEMTEPSIARARNLGLRERAALEQRDRHINFRNIPVASGELDAAFALLTAHELRTHAARLTFFRELHRTLRPGGRLIVAEHLRDPANLLAFGPGFLHFHSRAAWVRVAKEAGFLIDETFRITPFVIVFNLRRPVL